MTTEYETSHALKTETIKNCHAPQTDDSTLKSPLSVWSSNQSLIATYDNSKNMHWWKQHLGCHALVKGATPKLSRDPNFVVDEAIWFSSFFSSHNGSKLVILARLTVTKVADFCLLFIHTYLTYHHYSPLPFEKIHFFQPKKIFKKKSNFFLLTAESSNKFLHLLVPMKNTSPLLIRNWKKVPCVSISHWDNFSRLLSE